MIGCLGWSGGNSDPTETGVEVSCKWDVSDNASGRLALFYWRRVSRSLGGFISELHES